eukprot:scaffold116774_cov31-Tisochrysis_lutea.AAC.3
MAVSSSGWASHLLGYRAATQKGAVLFLFQGVVYLTEPTAVQDRSQFAGPKCLRMPQLRLPFLDAARFNCMTSGIEAVRKSQC